MPRDFVEDGRRDRMSWESSYSKKLPALTSLRTLVVSSLVNQTVFLRDTHAHAICGGEQKRSGYNCPDFQPLTEIC